MLFKYTTTITADSEGNATVYLGSTMRGYVKFILYDADTLNTATKIVLTGETTGNAIFTKDGMGTADLTIAPLVLASKSSDGSAYTDAGTCPVVVQERIKCVVSKAGNGGAGAITVIVDENL